LRNPVSGTLDRLATPALRRGGDRQEQATREALSWPATKREAEMVNQSFQS